eukprot:3492308-Amphidinium_carterae.1
MECDYGKNRIKELHEKYQPAKLGNVDRYLQKYDKVLMKLIWALEPEQPRSAMPTALEVAPRPKVRRKTLNAEERDSHEKPRRQQ